MSLNMEEKEVEMELKLQGFAEGLVQERRTPKSQSTITPSPDGRLKQLNNQSLFSILSLCLCHINQKGVGAPGQSKKEAFPLVKWLPFVVVSFHRALKAKRHSNDPEVQEEFFTSSLLCFLSKDDGNGRRGRPIVDAHP